MHRNWIFFFFFFLFLISLPFFPSHIAVPSPTPRIRSGRACIVIEFSIFYASQSRPQWEGEGKGGDCKSVETEGEKINKENNAGAGLNEKIAAWEM